MIPMEYAELAIVFVLGASIGSFLNVCIYRMPLDRSVVHPGSHCAACGSPIPWRHNIPILSWLLLRGRAACCGTRIDARYALVELLTGVMITALWHQYNPAYAVVWSVVVCGLIVASFIDFDHFIIPDEISLGGALLGVVLSTAMPELHGKATHWGGFLSSVIGLIVGGGGLMMVAIAGLIILRKEAMGMGDVKLMAAFGAFYGWTAPPFILAVASLVGSVAGMMILMQQKRMWGVRMPFGPYLALAGVYWLFGGREWMIEYLRFVIN